MRSLESDGKKGMIITSILDNNRDLRQTLTVGGDSNITMQQQSRVSYRWLANYSLISFAVNRATPEVFASKVGETEIIGIIDSCHESIDRYIQQSSLGENRFDPAPL